MPITLQARQADGTWAVRNAFVTENRKVVAGSMKPSDLEAQARAMLAKWNATMPGAQLRVHNSANDPKPAPRKTPEPSDNIFAHFSPRADACEHDFRGWREFSDGNGGEQVCAKCGMGAMHHSLLVGA